MARRVVRGGRRSSSSKKTDREDEGPAFKPVGPGAKAAKPQRQKKARRAARKPAKAASPTAANNFWKSGLLRKRNGDLLGCRANVSTILRHEWPDLLSFNEFTGEIIKGSPLVGHKSDRPAKGLRKNGRWTDDDTVLTEQWLERDYDVTCELQVVRDAVRVEARRRGFHPIRDFLDQARAAWDGRERAGTWLIRHALVKDTPYVREVSLRWLISAVARIYEPGCQVDHVLIIEGVGRSGKTSLLRALAGSEDWFVSTDVQLGDKDSLQMLSAKWIVELGELGSLGRTDWERVKHFITNKVDNYRRAYGHEVEMQPRSVVLAGTTNKFSGYLREPDQRFWPVRSHATVFDRVRLADLVEEREQLWGEAVARYRAGEPWYITDVDILKEAILEQEERAATDPWEARIHRYVSKSIRRTAGVTAEEILDFFGFSIKEVDRGAEMRIAGIMHKLGWVKQRVRKKSDRKYRYYPTV